MLYRIVQDIPGRLRLRCGRGLFDEEEALGVTQALCALGCVQSAEVHPANGSVLVSFAPAGREEVLSFMDALSAIALPKPVSEPTSDQALAISDNRFALEVSNLVAWRVLRRVFLPLPLRTAWTVLKTLPYLWKGLRSLLAGELKVEVLDASALLAAMIRGAFTDASSIMFLLELSDILCGHVEERAKLTLQEGLVAPCGICLACPEGWDRREDPYRQGPDRPGAPYACRHRASDRRHGRLCRMRAF